jgi:hypothetical protein
MVTEQIINKEIVKHLKKKIMKTIALIISGVLALSLYSCNNDEDTITDPVGNEGVELNYDFESDDEGWNAALAEFPVDEEDLYEFEVEQTTSPVDDEEGALLLSASNPNGNLFMYASKQISGLEPSTQYKVSYSLNVTSSVVVDTTGFVIDTTGVDTDTTGVDSDTTGVGDDNDDLFVTLNDTVVIKAGAVSEEPVTEANQDNFLKLIGISIGEPGSDGADLVVIGSFAADTTDVGFTEETVSTTTPISVITNEDGDLWLLVGTETFGNKTEIYFNSINVVIER